MSNYDYVFLISNIFGTYTIFRFMCIFFERDKSKRMHEFISYFIYFIFISYTHLIVNIPIITLIFNIGLFVLISFNYKSSMKKRLVSALFIYVILMSVESIVVIITGYIKLSLFDSTHYYSSIIGLISIKILSYLVVLVIQNFKNIKIGEIVPNSYWFSLIIIPLGTLYVTLLIFQNGNLNSNNIIICIIILFSINIIAFYLYDVLNSTYANKIEKTLLKQQIDYYCKQFEILEKSYKNVKSIRHDIKNHLFILATYIEDDDKDKTLDYIQTILNSSNYDSELAKSGNIDIDSMINYKLHNAKSNGIEVKVDLKIPATINIK